MRQRGFTLTELLVATIVFLVGFVSVFGLFLGGMRMRKLAEDTTRASLTASCIIEEIRIDAGGVGGSGLSSPYSPREYVGDGFAKFVKGTQPDKFFCEGAENDPSKKAEFGATTNPLFRYKPIPGSWYRVMNANDLSPIPDDPDDKDNKKNRNYATGNDANTTVLKLDLLVVNFGTADKTINFADLDRRLGLSADAKASKDADMFDIADLLVERGIGFRFTAVVTRRPSWMPANGTAP
jgi:prepilin-type N-terminal cleavage/methylation domain-containing protein